MKTLYIFIFLITFTLNAKINITDSLKQKAHIMLKEIKPIKSKKLTPKEFITEALLSTGLERYSLSYYISKDFSDAQAVFDNPDFYNKKCFNPKKYIAIDVEVLEKKVRPLFYPLLSKKNNFKCQYNNKNISKMINFEKKFHSDEIKIKNHDLIWISEIGILPISFNRNISIKKLISTQYQYEHLDIDMLEYPVSSKEFKEAYKILWK